MSPRVRRFTAVYDRDEDNNWIVRLAEEERVHTYGRTFAQAREAIRDATGLWFHLDADRFDVVDELSRDYQDPLDELAAARARLERDQDEVRERTLEVVRSLRDRQGATNRDIAEIVGLSHQRVHQILKEA
jgi:predicted RNase H-like HicB family nuclease